MNELFQKNKKALLFLGIFVALVVLYEVFFSGGGSTSASSSVQSLNPTAGGLVSDISQSPVNDIAGSDLLSMLTELRSITFDESIFSDPVYQSLKDKSQPLAPEPLGKSVGRLNPFSDFGRGSGAIATSTPSH